MTGRGYPRNVGQLLRNYNAVQHNNTDDLEAGQAGTPHLSWPHLPERSRDTPVGAEPFVWQPMPDWQVRLPLAGPPGGIAGPAPFPAALARWVHWSDEDGLVALVDGQPRPDTPPTTEELQADPGLAFLIAYAGRGQSALRHVEGPWSLVLWEAAHGQWLLATDRLGRCPLYWRAQDGWLEVADHPFAADDSGNAVPAGCHLRLGVDPTAAGLAVASSPAFHGSWRLERRDRRGWTQVIEECRERMTSVCRTLDVWPTRILLADDLTGAALLLASLQCCALLPQRIVWVEGYAGAALADWRRLAAYFAVPLQESARQEPGLEAPGPEEPGLAKSVQPKPDPATAARLRLALQAACRDEPAGALLSAQGLGVLLPPQPPGVLARCLRWRPWQADLPARPALYGAHLVRAFGENWQPILRTALRDWPTPAPLRPVWPWLDEVVAHPLANLPPVRRSGTPWQADFRAAMLQQVLPRPLRRALQPALDRGC